MRFLMLMSILAVPLSGCYQELFDAGAGLAPDTESSSGSSSTSTSEVMPTTSAGSGVQTVTGPVGETTSPTSSGLDTTSDVPEQNAPPTIDVFEAQPNALSEAGVTQIFLEASEDVVKVRLSRNGVEFAALTPDDFPYNYEVLSAKYNADTIDVVVEDAEGLTASAGTSLTVLLPDAGVQKCLFVDKTAASSSISALVYTETAIVAAGVRDDGGGDFKATIWKLDPDHCEVVLPGWPKTIGDWTADMDLATLSSGATALAVDEVGNLAVGINLLKGGNPQRYVAFLTKDGARLWEKLGKVGEEVAGVAIAPDVVVAVGWERTSENPVRTDAMVWQHLGGGNVWPQRLRAPFTDDEADKDAINKFNERARAVLYEPTTDMLYVVGERDFIPDFINTYNRTFVARFVPGGGQFGKPWTSPGGDSLLNDRANAVNLCQDEILVGGSARDVLPGATPLPLTMKFGFDGPVLNEPPGGYFVEPLPSAELHGVACDREGKLVNAATRTLGLLDVQVYAYEELDGPRTWYQQGGPGNDFAQGLGCDERGFCAWAGARTVDGKLVAAVRVHHP